MPERTPEPEALPPAPPTRGQGKTAWVGLFLVVGILGVLIVLFVMTDAAIFRGRYIISTVVEDAGGIRKGDPVQMRGVNIGRIMGFEISPGGVKIALEIEGEFKIPVDSRVDLVSAGMLGGMKADVIPGTATTYVKYGDSLPGRSEKGLADLDQLSGKAEDVLARVQRLLADETIGNVNASTVEMRKLLVELSSAVKEQRKELMGLTTSLRKSSAGLEKTANAPELERSIKRLDTISARMDDVTQTLDRGSRSMESVMARIERGEGSLGKLTKDDELYDNMSRAALNVSQATENINKLTEEIRRNPKKYL
ncbi:MAG TPA: MlaD family protein, partial [Vicinamibacteria bacterium]|nr:MlaD family protein [Vicinamibacteria bacterium]